MSDNAPVAIKNASFEIPAPGTLCQVGDGVYWLRMPLPMALDHINLYLLEDDDGWFVVDTGLGNRTTREWWQEIFTHLNSKPVKGVIVTHMHPDHIGQAGYLTEHWQVPLYMTRLEYFVSRSLRGGGQGADDWVERQYYRLAGVNEGVIEQIMGSTGGYGKAITPIPTSMRRLEAGKALVIKGRQWRVMVGRGHSPEHACLYCDDLSILISGDHILPRISPNIGVYSTEPEANPLEDYLVTLLQFYQLPANTLVLPAHNQPFYGLHLRIDALREHHNHVMDVLLDGCQQPATAMALLPVMFQRELEGFHQMLALAECLAHLNCLINEGKVVRTLENGTYLYAALDAGDAHALDNDAEMTLLQV